MCGRKVSNLAEVSSAQHCDAPEVLDRDGVHSAGQESSLLKGCCDAT